MKNIKIVLAFFAFAIIVSCNSDDLTGDSARVLTNPTLSVALGFANDQTLVEQEASYDFTVNLSQAQNATVVVYLSQVGGTATDGVDFSFPHTISIPAGSTSASGAITIHADAEIEDTETAVIKIATGFEANTGAISSQTVTFNIMNLVEGDLGIGMSWATAIVTDNSGNEIGATDFADLRLLVSTGPNNTDLIGGADGGSFEAYSLPASTPDGEYYVVADFYAASDIVRDIDITLTFDQVGVITGQTHEFAAALNNASICPANFVVLAKVTKSGDSYTFEELNAPNFAVTSWPVGSDVIDTGTAPDGYASQITTSVDCTGSFLLGINAGWMLDFWGEEIIAESNIYYTNDGAGNITIASQDAFTTLFSGTEYPYTISGTGTIDEVAGTLTVNYFLDQEGFSPNQWAFDNGFISQNYFIANVSQ